MSKRYTEEFKVDAVKQVVERGYSVTEISKRLGVSGHSLYKWVKEFGGGRDKRSAGEVDSIRRENAQLKADLKRVARLMRSYRIRAQRGYKKPRHKYGKPSVVAPNRLAQQFGVAATDYAWVTDITLLRTYEGWLYLAVVLDLHSRMVVGWSMKPSLAKELALDTLLMAVWRRRPQGEVIIHSDQGSQYGSGDWLRFCRGHKLTVSMSRRGNCFDDAVAESFFSSLNIAL